MAIPRKEWLAKLATHIADKLGRTWVKTHGRTMTLHGEDVNDAHAAGPLHAHELTSWACRHS